MRRPYKRNEYRKVILPLTVLRRFDCLWAPTKEGVLKVPTKIKGRPDTVIRGLLQRIIGRPFYNLSKLDTAKPLDDPNQLAPNLNSYIQAFSKSVREIMERFAFDQQIARMAERNLLYEVIKAFANVDLSPERVDNTQMGYIFEESIRIGAEQSNEEAGELNAFSLIVPDINLFIEMHVVKEAQTSSRIEGTQTGIDEVLLPEEQVAPEKHDDWREVRNCIDALNSAIKELEKLPLSNRLLKKTHAILLRGVRGEHKQPGEFRTSQNWIGGSSLADAAFIPPHHDQVPELMSDLEKFWHDDAIVVPNLVRIAISHYQFETIHPFLDGKGRIGRLLITLYLVSKDLLVKPSLYLSDFFERNRGSYYDALTAVRTSNDIIHWLKFFLTGVAETATKGRNAFQRILALRTDIEHQLLGLGKRARNARHALEVLYRRPVIGAAELQGELGISHPTRECAFKGFERLKILKKVAGGERSLSALLV